MEGSAHHVLLMCIWVTQVFLISSKSGLKVVNHLSFVEDLSPLCASANGFKSRWILFIELQGTI